MNKLIFVIFGILTLGAFVCCHNNKDEEYFNGEIRYFDDNRKIVKNVISSPLPLYGRNYGEMAVYDSLMIFWNPKLPDHFFNIFNTDTGIEIGAFCAKGRGPKEAISLNPIFQLYKNRDDVTTMLKATNENRLLFWNISQSVEKGTTIFDAIVPYSNINKDKSSNYLYMFRQSENTLLANIPSIFLSDTRLTTPAYEKRTINSDEFLEEYPIYKISELENKKSGFIQFYYFYSFDAIKPDGSKIVQAMKNLPQINIIDTQTGKVIGYRMSDSPDFSLFDTGMRSTNVYYNSVQVDDKYIYVTYWGGEAMGCR